MFKGIKIYSLISTIVQFIKEKNRKPLPPHSRFDHALYESDTYNGISLEEKQNRLANGYYHTTKPIEQFDLMKYREDVLNGVSPYDLEKRRLEGVYGAVKPIMNTANKNNCSLWNGYPSDLVCDVERYEYDRKKGLEIFNYGLIPKNTYIRIWNEKCWRF